MANFNNKPSKLKSDELLQIFKNSKSIILKSNEFAERNVGTTSSFAYDIPTTGIKSTQQLNVDWSKFENHTFFNSAEVNVNVAFDRIINYYPFDGTQNEVEKFFENLTGFEKHVFNRFPKCRGYLNFDSSYIQVKDYTGASFPELSKDKTGNQVLTPEGSMTFEFHLFVPNETNPNQFIFQKANSQSSGFSSFIKSSSISTADIVFSIVSGTNNVYASASIDKGSFQHLALVYDYDNDGVIKIYKNGALTQTSDKKAKFDLSDIKSSNFLIGSGVISNYEGTTFTPTQTLSASLDEFRYFHSARTKEQINANMKKSIFSSDNLKLYFKFNEPTGTLGENESDVINSIVLDSSGKSLHSYITNYVGSLRSTSSISSPMTNEKLMFSPVLFPASENVVLLNTELLLSATAYDLQNPNVITKLIPKHYLLEGKYDAGFSSENGYISEAYDGESIPGSGKLGDTQLILSLLYVWAKFFDEMKLYVDSFNKINCVDYNQNSSASDHFLPLMFKKMGFDVPSFFIDASIEQYIDSENIQQDFSMDEYSLQYIQNQLSRRVLTNLVDIIKSKGTIYSVKSFLRSLGFDPDNSFKIKEYGGATKRNLNNARETKVKSISFTDFVFGGLLTSNYLSGSRIEVGFPQPAGTFTNNQTYNPHGISNNKNDGLFTSGSWTYEAIYKFPKNRILTNATQSLIRLNTTGTNTPAGALLFNVVAISSSIASDSKVMLYARPALSQSLQNSPLLTMYVSQSIFDGEPWNISFGRTRNDEISSVVSSSYFLRVAKQESGEISKYVVTKSFFYENGSNSTIYDNALQNITYANTSGSFFTIGSGTINYGTAGDYVGLNNTTLVSDNIARETTFVGQVSRIRFWTKSLTEEEWKSHVLNPDSLGTKTPSINFNFEHAATGSFEKLRVDVSCEQATKTADANGILRLFDYSQNGFHISGTQFASGSTVVSPYIWTRSVLASSIDEATTTNKVRVRGYQDYEKATSKEWTQFAPAYYIGQNEEPQDDTRFGIEFSLVDSLNGDIMNIFSTLDELDNVLGNPENMFSQDYPNLEILRDNYFNRLTDKINFNRFFDVYRWFDSSISSFIENIVPQKTIFYGSNFVVEQHLLERNKIEYQHADIYVSQNNKYDFKNSVFEQHINAETKKY